MSRATARDPLRTRHEANHSDFGLLVRPGGCGVGSVPRPTISSDGRDGSSDAQQAWDVWRSDVANETVRDSAVERDVPQSRVPPALVLLTDHFGACLLVSLVITTALYWTFAFMIGGVLTAPMEVPKGPGAQEP